MLSPPIGRTGSFQKVWMRSIKRTVVSRMGRSVSTYDDRTRANWAPQAPSSLKGQEGYFVSSPVHCKKRLASFPSPAGMSLTKLSLAGNNDVIYKLFLPRESLVSDVPAEDGNIANLFFYRVVTSLIRGDHPPAWWPHWRQVTSLLHGDLTADNLPPSYMITYDRKKTY